MDGSVKKVEGGIMKFSPSLIPLVFPM